MTLGAGGRSRAVSLSPHFYEKRHGVKTESSLHMALPARAGGARPDWPATAVCRGIVVAKPNAGWLGCGQGSLSARILRPEWAMGQ